MRIGLDRLKAVLAILENMNWVARRLKDSSLDVSKAKSALTSKLFSLQKSIQVFKNEVEREQFNHLTLKSISREQRDNGY